MVSSMTRHGLPLKPKHRHVGKIKNQGTYFWRGLLAERFGGNIAKGLSDVHVNRPPPCMHRHCHPPKPKLSLLPGGEYGQWPGGIPPFVASRSIFLTNFPCPQLPPSKQPNLHQRLQIVEVLKFKNPSLTN